MWKGFTYILIAIAFVVIFALLAIMFATSMSQPW